MASIIHKLQKQFRISDAIVQLVFFGFVGATGAILNTFVLYLLTAFTPMHYLLAAAIATQLAIFSNFIGNHILTFQGGDNRLSMTRKFLRFQAVSMIGLVLTLTMLWVLTTLFGLELLLIWNLVAILVTFLANFTLNKKFTWGNAELPLAQGKKLPGNAAKAASVSALKLVLLAIFGALCALVIVNAAHADTVAVSQLGYHADAPKRVIVYTEEASGTLTLQRGSTNAGSFPLARPTDAEGNPTSCQGGQSCLVADISSVTTAGTYTATSSTGATSPPFTIGTNVFASAAPTMLEFFDAQLQQGSAYHADMHAGYTPALPAAADGSFIMVSDQAALTLMRLGSAYRLNPSLFQTDNYNILGSGHPDIVEHIKIYSDYLIGLQGVDVQEVSDGSGFRLDRGIHIENAFVPGPTALTSIDVYIPGANGAAPTLLQTVPVVSLCGSLAGAEQTECLAHAEQFYKCQIDEPCLNMTYNDRTGVASTEAGNYAVARGWSYEFGCYIDVAIGQEAFNGDYNPCLIFDPTTSREQTAETLLAFVQAIPAIHEYSPSEAQALLDRAVATRNYIRNAYPSFGAQEDTGYYGAALFILYDYTQDESYLQEAHALRTSVSTTFIADSTRGNEYYWEEYIRHKGSLEQEGLPYAVGGREPEAFLWGKLHYDYEQMSPSISSTGERVYQFDNSIQFHNSRFMLTEALLAAKAARFYANPDPFILEIANNQLNWLTGMNQVQKGVSGSSPLGPQSFIFGIGRDQPTQFHSRYLADTGYAAASGGSVVGVRGTGYQFLDADAGYVHFDGASSIVGSTLGAFGNGYHGETSVFPPFSTDKTFSNGRTVIPGWVNGPYDKAEDSDTIFNYQDNINTYEFTETTNEIVATAIELLAYLDAEHNGKTMPQPPFGRNPPIITVPGNTTNTTNTTASLTVTSVPSGASVQINGAPAGTTPVTLSLAPTMYNVFVYTLNASNSTMLSLQAGQSYTHNAVLSPLNSTVPAQRGNLTVTSTPPGAYIRLNGEYAGTTDNSTGRLTVAVPAGLYSLRATKTGYYDYTGEVAVTAGAAAQASVQLQPFNATVSVTTEPAGASVFVDGVLAGTAPASISLAPGTHTLSAATATLVSADTPITVAANERRSVNLQLNQTLAPARITAGSTTVGTQGDNHYMLEGSTGQFTATLDRKGVVQWSVDGVLKSTTLGTSSSFGWTPNAVFVESGTQQGDVRTATVTATSGNATRSWTVDVEDVVNPFYRDQKIGSPSVEVNVYTNNRVSDFTTLSFTIENSAGQQTYQLQKVFENEDESAWEYQLTGLPSGNTYIRKITGLDGTSGNTLSFTLDNERPHYAGNGGTTGGESPRSERRSARDSTRSSRPTPPQLVYVLFGKDVISMNETQNITLDARDDYGVKRAQANILQPNGDVLPVELTLVSGTKSYGTWYAEISSTVPGEFTLASVTFEDELQEPTEIPIEEKRAFYVSGSGSASEELGLVYALLDKSKVRANTTVTLRLDARDMLGITEVTAQGTNNRGGEFTIPMELVSGDGQYGTWEGLFVAERPDSTYSVTNITLSNGEETKSYAITARSVYVESLPRSLTGNVVQQSLLLSKQGIQQLLRKPLVPTVIGFIIMAIIVSAVLLKDDIRSRFRQYRRT